MKEAIVLERADYNAIMDRIERLEKHVEILEECSVEWVTVKEAARILGKHKNTVYSMLKNESELEKSVDGKSIAVSMKSIREYRQKYKVAA